MIIQETVKGPDGRLYLVLRKVAPNDYLREAEFEDAQQQEHPPEPVIIDMHTGTSNIIEFNFNLLLKFY